MADTIIIAHRDLDGIASAALYTHCRRRDIGKYKVVYTEPHNLLQQLRRYYRRGRKYVVVDIGLNRDVYEELMHMSLDGVAIEWYDHHIWEKEWIENLKQKGASLEIDRTTCATGVIARGACRESSNRIDELVEIVCGADLWKFDRYESPFLFRYADLYNNNGWRAKVFELIEMYLDGIATGIVDQIEKEVSNYVDEELRVLSALSQDISVVDTYGILLCVYVKKHHIPSASIIGNRMLGICDIAVIVNENLKNISLRSKRCNVREMAKVFGGGGHSKAAGAPLHIPMVYRVFKGLSLNLIRDRIASEIIEKIKNEGIDFRDICAERS